MARRHIVRAREHSGTNSLDLTVPASICADYGIEVGDMFKVDASESGGQLSLIYRRVYKAHEREAKQGSAH